MIYEYIYLFLLYSYLLQTTMCLTASSDTLLWKGLNKSIDGISTVEEAFLLVPADYEDANSPMLTVNIRRFTANTTNVSGDPVNVWFIPGGPGQSSKSLEEMIPVFLRDLPHGSIIYAIDHRGLGKSTPLASSKEKELLEEYPKQAEMLKDIVMKEQGKLGILTPITKVLRIENVARDLLKSVNLVNRSAKKKLRHFIVGISYGTMVARRALQIAPVGMFEGVLLDGLAPTEKIEQSNEADRIIEEVCQKVPECKNTIMKDINGRIKVRGIIPEILKRNNPIMNSCTSYFLSIFANDTSSLCSNLHEFMNAVLLTGRASVKVGALRLMKEMAQCGDPDGFKLLFDAIYEELLEGQSVNQLQSVAAVNREIKATANKLSSDELVFEVVSALERYGVTRSSMNICFNRKHSVNGDEPETCPSRLFDPCKFFRTTWERKEALREIDESSSGLPPISIKTPMVVAPETRIIVLAGNLDFNTPTWLSRQITAKYTKAKEVYYHEFFGYGHGTYGSSDCDHEIFSELLNGNNQNAEECVRKSNEKNIRIIDGYFKKSLNDLATFIKDS